LIEKNGKLDNTQKMGTNGSKKIGHMEPIQKQILDLLVQYKDGLTAEEIRGRTTVNEKSVTVSLSELRKKRLIYAVDEQREDRIWRTRYFLRSEILKSNSTKVV
jgi:DNA-binding transcriptional ArsR family regulator